jgi:hypothetical protein
MEGSEFSGRSQGSQAAGLSGSRCSRVDRSGPSFK